MIALALLTAAVLSTPPAPESQTQGTVSAKAEAEQSKPSLLKLGVQLDVGLPNGAGVQLVYRPWHFLRVHAGVAHNTFSTGINGGVSLIPFNFWITPALTLEGGYMFPGDANNAVRLFTGDAGFQNAALQNISYAYGNAHVGLEFGPPRRFTFYIRGGLTYLDGNLGGFQALLQQADPTITASNLHLRMTLPTAKLGFVVYFL